MRIYKAFLAAYIIVMPPQIAADHEALAIVVMHSSPLVRLSLDTLKQVYLRKTLLDKNGKRWIPLNLQVSDKLRQSFSLALFKKRPEEQESYWNEQYFHGINPPEVLASEEAVLRFVAITPGAIGYVRKSLADNRVKIINVIEVTH